MAGERIEAPPEGLDAWLDAKADALEIDRDAVVSRALAAYRTIEDGSFDDVDDRIGALDRRLSSVESEFDGKLSDVRERVVQIKQEADAKATAEHGHPDLRELVERTNEALADTDGHVDGDGGGHRDTIGELAAAVDAFDEKADTLARALVRLQNRLDYVETTRNERESVTDLQAAANRAGETAADCGACGESVVLGLLSRPHCPHCGARVTAFEPSSGLFGSATLCADAHGQRATSDRTAPAGDDRSNRGDAGDAETGVDRDDDDTARAENADGPTDALDPLEITDD